MLYLPVPAILIFPNPPTAIEVTIEPAPNDLWRIEAISPESGDAFLAAVREGLRPPEAE